MNTSLELKVKSSKLSKGFTLVELLIYMGLFSILTLVFTEIFTSLIGAQLNSQATSTVAYDGRYLYSRLIYDINRAQAVSTPANLGDTSTSLIATVNGYTFTYSLQNGNLMVTENTGTYALNSADTTVSNLQFRRIGNAAGKHTFRINFVVTSRITQPGSQPEVRNFQTTAGLR